MCLNKYGDINKALNHIPLRHGISHSDIIKSYMSSLSLGKSDFEAVEIYRQDKHFKTSLAIKQIPSTSILRQRLDKQANELLPIMDECNIDFMANAKVLVTPLKMGHVALDMDVYPMNNEKTKKEGVWRMNCAKGSNIAKVNFNTP